jgi:PAS domain S-box-containing protein
VCLHCSGADAVLDDAASFLTAAVFWASHSCGAVSIADVLLPGAPLVFVNEVFLEMCGFSSEEALGRSCRFLQGPETEPEAVASIQACLAAGADCHVRVTNYRKDGSTFNNLLALRPIKDSCGVLRFVIGLQSEVRLPLSPSQSCVPPHAHPPQPPHPAGDH